MLTQAFAFEAIRVLEGYWGTFRPVEWVAALRCAMHRRTLTRLERRRAKLTEKALEAAVKEINARHRKPYVTPNMESVLKAWEFGRTPVVPLTSAEEKRLRKFVWENSAPPEPMRRRVNVDKRIRDFPRADHPLPTRLGNVLRCHEDQLDAEDIESFVQDVFDDLPSSVQQSHDEERNRLDLYCSMVFVLALGALATQIGGRSGGAFSVRSHFRLRHLHRTSIPLYGVGTRRLFTHQESRARARKSTRVSFSPACH